MLKSSAFFKLLYPKRQWCFNDGPIYLTFDDGPIPEVTPWVLDQLKQHQAKATFFCIGDNIKKHPAIFKQILASGHSVGNHTMHHLNGWQTKLSQYLADIETCDAQLAQHGVCTRLFRPPYGKCTSKQAKLLLQQQRKLIMWDVLTKDYKTQCQAEQCFKIYQQQSQAGSIVVMHDSKKAFPRLKHLLPQILKQDSSFKAIPM